MKKSFKKTCLIACSLVAFIGAAQTYANFHHENTCLILLDGVNALSSDTGEFPPKCYTINNEVFDVSENMEHAYCVPNPATTGNKHCLPQDDHEKNANECKHQASTTHLSDYSGTTKSGMAYTVHCTCMP